MKKLEYIFEGALWSSRLCIIFPVIASIVSAFLMVAIGTYDVYHTAAGLFHAIGNPEEYHHVHKEAITAIISAVDAYLIATVLLIFGIGLYELFISKVDQMENDTNSSRILVIHSLDELKEKLAKVIIMVLVVTFFRHAVDVEYETMTDLLALSGGIFLISLSIYFMHKEHKEGK